MKILIRLFACLLVFFTACKEKTEILDLNKNVRTEFDVRDKPTEQVLLKFENQTEDVGFPVQGCDPDVFVIDEGIVWEYECYDEAEMPGFTPATELLDQYFTSCIGLLSQSPNEDCDVISNYFVYEENRVVEGCPDLIPFTYLEFNSTCYPCPNPQGANFNISGDELRVFADFIMGQALASVPQGYEIMGLDALYTDWHECTHLQRYYQCEPIMPPPNIIPCNAGYLDDYCDSACRYCESRRIVFELFYRKCVPLDPPVVGECSMTVTLESSKEEDWNIPVSTRKDDGSVVLLGEICNDPAACDFPITAVGGSVTIPITSDCKPYFFYTALAPLTIEITTPAGSTTRSLEPFTSYVFNLSCTEVPCE